MSRLATAASVPGFVRPEERDAVPFRTIRAVMDLEAKRRGDTALVFTGTFSGEGTSTVASNYALVSASAGYSTLIIDANLSRPSLHRRLACRREPGFVDVVAGDVSFGDALQRTTVENVDLWALTAGAPVPSSLDVINFPGTFDLLGDACEHFDVVVIDTPPVLSLADVAVLSARRDIDTVLVVGERQRRARVSRTIGRLRRAGGNVIGVVVNAG